MTKISRRTFIAGSAALSGLAGLPVIGGAQPAPIKIGLIHPMTGFVSYNGQQCRLGALLAIDDVNKQGGIKSMGGAMIDPLQGDSQSKVEVGVSEAEKMSEQGIAAYVGCFQSPVGIAASQVAAKNGIPFLVDVGVSDLLMTRGLTNIFRLCPGFGIIVDDGIASLDALNKAANSVAKTAVVVHESGEMGTGATRLIAGKLPSIGIQVKEVIAHDNPTRNFDNIALRIRSANPDLIMMCNYQNEYMLLARTLHQQKVNGALLSILGGGFNYKFVKDMPDVSQYVIDVNHSYNPRSEKARQLKKRVESSGGQFTLEVYLSYSTIMLLADSLERAASVDKEKLTQAIASSTFKPEIMPYGPTKFVNGQNQGGRAAMVQAQNGEIEVIAPEEFASAKAVFPRPRF